MARDNYKHAAPMELKAKIKCPNDLAMLAAAVTLPNAQSLTNCRANRIGKVNAEKARVDLTRAKGQAVRMFANGIKLSQKRIRVIGKAGE